jgi:hypothetical protein
MKRPLITAALSAAALAVSAAAANASVTLDPNGVGFVGKGDVQTAFGWNNAAIQKAVESGNITFTTKQDAAQAYSQSAQQTASQSASQEAGRVPHVRGHRLGRLGRAHDVR